MSYGKKTDRYISSLEADAAEKRAAADAVERRPGDNYVTENPEWQRAIEATIEAEAAAERERKSAEKEMRKAAERAREAGSDSYSATTFRDTYGQDPNDVEKPEGSCSIM